MKVPGGQVSEAAFFEITDNELDGCRGTAVGLGPLPQSGHCGVGVEGVVSRAGHKSWLGVRPNRVRRDHQPQGGSAGRRFTKRGGRCNLCQTEV